MFSKLQEWAIALGGILFAILGAMGYAYQKGRSGKEREDAKASLKQTAKAQEALQKAQQEGQSYVEKVDSEPADDLSSFDDH